MIFRKQNELRFGADVHLLEDIPVANWLLLFDDIRKEYYLEEQLPFELPEKIYGEEEALTDRYVNTYNKKDTNMGVLLTGDKGNGKSLTAKMICIKSKLPVIMVTQPFVGEAYQNFLGSMKQEVVLFYDEFEKVYPQEEKKQEEFLPILDGIFQSKKLFLFTTNSMEINEFLMNRPGRIRYLRKYRGLEKPVIKEVISDTLENKEHEKSLMELINILSNISMDVLIHIIDEMNLYDEAPLDAVRHLNVQVEHSEFDVLMFINGKRHMGKIHYNPLTVKHIWVSYKETDDRNNTRWKYYEKDIDEFDVQAIDGEFIFKDRDDNKLIFTASKPFEFSL